MKRLHMERLGIDQAATLMVALWSYVTEHDDEMAASLHDQVAEAQEVYLAMWEGTDDSAAIRGGR